MREDAFGISRHNIDTCKEKINLCSLIYVRFEIMCEIRKNPFLVTGLSVDFLQFRSHSIWNHVEPPRNMIKNAMKYLVETDQLDVFFSHVWSSPPFLKHVGVLWYLNGVKAAIAATICVLIVAFSLSLVDSRWWVRLEQNSGLTAQSLISIFGTLLLFTFILTFDVMVPMFIQSLFIPKARRVCFIDRCCINQENPEAKSRGIREIPSFLDMSRTLVILLSETYFDRLWCCYELAVFRSYVTLPSSNKSTPRSVVLVPLKFVGITYLMTVFDMLSSVLFRSNFRSLLSKDNNNIFIIVSVTFGCLTASLAYLAAELWARDLHRIKQRVANFTLDSVNCTDESDRIALLEDIGKRFNGATKFEAVVRSELMREIGHRPKFKYAIFIALPTLFSLMGYLPTFGQRLSLICMTQLGSKDFTHRDDSTCVILDRTAFVNVFQVITAVISRICYYPVILGTVIWFNTIVHRFNSKAIKTILRLGGLIVITGFVIAESMHYEDIILTEALKAGMLLMAALILYLSPILRKILRNKREPYSEYSTIPEKLE